nr:zinc finger, CCHC-type, retrotransposon Gag domain protein [Tanacetum cinerariifolium]
MVVRKRVMVIRFYDDFLVKRSTLRSEQQELDCSFPFIFVNARQCYNDFLVICRTVFNGWRDDNVKIEKPEEEVHPVLPHQDDTMHERPAGKIMLYTRFFDFANFRDPALVTTAFNAQDYATLMAHPSPFRKFPEAFLCLVRLSRHYTLDEKTYPWFVHKDGEDMDLFAFIHAPNPTKVRVVEPELDEGEPWLLETTVGRTILLLPVAPDRAEIVEVVDTIVEDAALVQSRRQGMRKSVVVDAGGDSNPPKKPRKDHETLSKASICAEPNLHTIGALGRFVISSDSSHHSGTNVAEAKVDSLIRSSASIMTTVTTTTPTVDPTFVTKEKVVEPSLFGAGSSSAGGTDPITCVFSDLTGSDFLSVTNGSHLDDGRVCREMVDEFAPLKFFASFRGMEQDQLFTEFNVKAVHQMSLSTEVRMRAEYNFKEKRRLKSAEAQATEAIRLHAEASNFETLEKSLRGEANALRKRNVILEKERDALDVKVTKLETSSMSKERELADSNALERLKREYHSIRQTNTETSTEFMQHFLRLAGFLEAAAGTEEEQAKNFQLPMLLATMRSSMRGMMMTLSDQTSGRRVVIGFSRPLNRVVTGTMVIITTVMDQTGEVVVTTIAATTTTLATTTGILVMGMTRETGVSSLTDMPILVLSSPGVPLTATPTRFALRVDADT